MTSARCSVCDQDDELPLSTNRLITCGNCSLHVHQGCYGINEQVNIFNWFCRKCESQVRMSKIRCDLCPVKDGALKRSVGGRYGWAHVLCALYIPQVTFSDPKNMDTVLLDMVSSDNFGRSCVFCERTQRSSQANHGICIQCASKSCRTYFHVTCAHEVNLLSPLPASLAGVSISLAEVLLRAKSESNHTENSSKSHSVKPGNACRNACLVGFCSIRHKEAYLSGCQATTSHSEKIVQNLPTADSSSLPLSTCVNSDDDPALKTSTSAVGPMVSEQASISDNNSSFTSSSSLRIVSECKSIKVQAESSALPLAGQYHPNVAEAVHPNAPVSVDSNRPCVESESDIICPPSSINLSDPTISSNTVTMAVEQCLLSKTSMSDDSRHLPSKSLKGLRLAKRTHGQRQAKKVRRVSASSVDISSTTAFSSSPSLTQSDLPLVWPQRPLPIRGLGLSELRSGLSHDNVASSPATATDVLSTNSPTLTTMQDLLEWQWDQAGALLMQQAGGCDVVSLLDCLHKLKAENDSLEAKLVRLETRHQHLRSVNSRLFTSLTTMKGSRPSLSPESLITTTNISKKSIISPTVYSPAGSGSEQFAFCTSSHPPGSTNTLVPAKSQSRRSNQRSGQTKGAHKRERTSHRHSPFSVNPPQKHCTLPTDRFIQPKPSKNGSSTSHPNQFPTYDSLPPTSITPKISYDSPSASVDAPLTWSRNDLFKPSVSSISPQKLLDPEELRQLSARLSYAIAARKPMNSATKCDPLQSHVTVGHVVSSNFAATSSHNLASYPVQHQSGATVGGCWSESSVSKRQAISNQPPCLYPIITSTTMSTDLKIPDVTEVSTAQCSSQQQQQQPSSYPRKNSCEIEVNSVKSSVDTPSLLTTRN